jgi:hypothetical protein
MVILLGWDANGWMVVGLLPAEFPDYQGSDPS